MVHNNKIPNGMEQALYLIGERISTARKRRKLTMEDMALRMFVTRKTLSRLEKGDPGVSLGVLASALWVLGLEKDLLSIAAPENDKTGAFLEKQRLPERVRKSAPPDELDF
jgi:transcriptional regulator with XRE-family HTH domain